VAEDKGPKGSGTNSAPASAPATNQISAPTISLPKGGGAIRGIGEKFGANPVTGTGSLSVPIATSPGRSGFGPQLSLSYDSGAGNGPFGLGWNHSLPSITRKTDKGLPEYHDLYHDAVESDVFILSGTEDLVPVLTQSAGGPWVPEVVPPRVVNGATYWIERYRPRIEGLFSRIERWRNQFVPQDTFWRSISKDNITSWYGRTENSRIADPADATHIFTWLICESYDDKGNVIAYEYKQENSDNVDLSQVHEQNRTTNTRGANRYLKHIRYGNHTPYFPQLTPTAAWSALPAHDQWYFQVVFDYGEHDTAAPTPEGEVEKWARRRDPFSSYRSGFEIRTYRLCQRVLMFHRFPELGATPCLVASTDFMHQPTMLASYLTKVIQSGYTRRTAGTYLRKSIPPVEFTYSEAIVDETTTVRHLDRDSLINLPQGIDGTRYTLVDLDGEGLSGILTKQGGGWFYKRNLSPITQIKENGREVTVARFGAAELVATLPSLAVASSPDQVFLDLAGDGTLDAVSFHGPTPGFYERTSDGNWGSFVPFQSLPNVDWNNPNLRFIDLTGDGHADLVITEDDVLLWYRSLAEDGFGPPEETRQALDEEIGPKCVFGEPEQTIFLADMSGDGLADIVRIKYGEVCYWPNRGYGRFGAKVTMDHIPRFDTSEQFNATRIRLADIDGSGVADIIYLASDGPRLYFNQSGNGWSDPTTLYQCPPIDSLSSVVTADLLSNGTACLVWSSPLAAHAHRPLRYIQLMGQKPHLLTGMKNNLGAETRVQYAPSTKFYLADAQAGRPWITRIPFPVHVVERVETYDWISRNRFVTRYAYHDGFFDGEDREFRGFGMVEQFDTEEFAALSETGKLLTGENIDKVSHVPPVRTKTWFHTGAFLEGEKVSLHFAHEYFGAPRKTEPNYEVKFREFLKTLLPDTIMPPGLTLGDEREACRALKGSILRQEVYAKDGSLKEAYPYSVSERSYAIEPVQAAGTNRHGVFFVHPRETVNYHHERNPTDPRVGHELILKVDGFGNIERAVAVGYPRRNPPADLPEQGHTHMTLTVSRVANRPGEADWYRVGVPVEARTFEVVKPLHVPAGGDTRLTFDDVKDLIESLFPLTQDAPPNTQVIPYENWNWRQAWNPSLEPGRPGVSKLRLIEHVRALYRKDDLSGPLSLGQVELLAVPYESYKLALTPGLLTQVYGARVNDAMLASEGRYVHSEGDANWWIPSGRAFYSPGRNDTAAQELAHGRLHFFLPYRYRDPFHTSLVSTETVVGYDAHDLFVVQTEDAAGNTVTTRLNYRVLQPTLVTDPNGNRVEAVLDTLGMVAGTAIMGKSTESHGDTLTGFEADLTEAQTLGFYDALDPHVPAPGLLKSASTRIIYDVDRFSRTQQAHPTDPLKWQPSVAATLARETHSSDPLPPQGLKIQLSFSHSDGFGREIQKKVQAEPGALVEGGPVVAPRWVGSGWTIFNNKGKPVRQYEPFFSATHGFEFARIVGVSSILFYDPVERVVATLHPNHTYEKVVFDPWQQMTWDVNDTLKLNPKTDPDVSAFFTRLPDADYLPTWFQRMSASTDNDEKYAAQRTQAHADTSATAHVDALGHPFLTIADNGTQGKYKTRIELDIEGNQRAVIDAKDRVVMRYDYDMLGNRIHQASMEAGERWMLSDVAGKPIHAWDSRGHSFRTEYDSLRRPLRSFVTGADPANLNQELLIERLGYGEQHPEAELRNLRGKLYLHLDQAGSVTTEAHDFKGNPLRASRRLTNGTQYRQAVNWRPVDADHVALPTDPKALLDPVALAITLAPRLEADTYTSRTTYDALNRLLTATSPDGSIYRPTFNEANLLDKVDVNLRGAAATTLFVKNIDYNAKGQRTRIAYGNGAATVYTNDDQTFRLMHLKTSGTTATPDTPVFQDLFYTYDPAGNITNIRDDAQQTIYFNGQVVPPQCDYTYDAIYRLINATSREHIGQLAQPETTWNDEFHVKLPQPGDGPAMRNYTEQYLYDAVGNFEKLIHQASNGNWTRAYAYHEASLIEAAKKSNRLSSTTVGRTAGNLPSELYSYDAHGNMTSMPHLPTMEWDFKDQLHALQRQVVNDGGTGEKTYYVYDSGGQRVRKVTETQSSKPKDARIYLGGFEIYREFDASGAGITLERETLHIMDDKQRIALVESRTQGDDGSPPQLIHYQFGNHLGSASLELNDKANVISYEEYYPYGSTSYQAVDQSIKAAAKRYRYTGKERDEETGFTYHGARYYAAWLGRWTACDPIAPDGRLNVYAYAADNPLNFIDPNGKQEVYEKGHTFTPEEEARFRAAHEAFLKENPSERFAEEHPIATEIIEAIQFVGAVIFLAQDLKSLTSGFRLPSRQKLAEFHADERGAMKIPGTGIKASPTTPPKAPNTSPAKGPTVAPAPAKPAAASKPAAAPAPKPAAAPVAKPAAPKPTAPAEPTSPTPSPPAALPAPTALPTWKEGQPTRGVLDTGLAQIELSSGERGGPAPLPLPGRNNTDFAHVEAHAAQSMRVEGLKYATLYINRVPCAVGPGCANNLPIMLPEGAKLRVIGPGGYDHTFVGLPDSPKYPRNK